MSGSSDKQIPAVGAFGAPIVFSDCFPSALAAERNAGGGDDERVVYLPAILPADGVGATLWSTSEASVCDQATTMAAADLASRFVPYARCPSHVQAMLVAHANRMLERLMDDVQRFGG